MLGNPLGRLSRDMQAAARDLDDLNTPTRELAEAYAAASRDEAPVVTGYLVSTVFADDTGMGVSAIYAGVVHDSNPYAERAVDRVDELAPFEEYVDDVLDSHLSPIYV